MVAIPTIYYSIVSEEISFTFRELMTFKIIFLLNENKENIDFIFVLNR